MIGWRWDGGSNDCPEREGRELIYQDFAYYYDRLMEDMPYVSWLRFAKECWARHGKPTTVVDLGCGTGNLSIPLSQQGYAVTGIDLSADMLAIAQEKAGELHATWIEQDMREWELPELVDSVVSFCDCMNYLLEEEDVERTFRQTYAGLREGGVFMFDVLTSWQFQRYAEQQPFVYDEEDLAYMWTCDFDQDRLEIEHRLAIFAQVLHRERSAGSSRQLYHRIDEVHVQRAYDLDWLAEVLTACGFKTVELYGDFRFAPPTPHTERAFFVALK